MTEQIPAWRRHLSKLGDPPPERGELPIWSGRGDPPAIGSEVVCNDKPKTRVTVTGYSVEGGYLMVEGYRTADPARRGNLAGAEILWPIAAEGEQEGNS